MASNSSAAAVAALFGIRDIGDHQDQIKPLLAQQHRQQPLMALTAGPDQATATVPPVKKKRNLPGKIIKQVSFDLQFHSCMHSIASLSHLTNCLDPLGVPLERAACNSLWGAHGFSICRSNEFIDLAFVSSFRSFDSHAEALNVSFRKGIVCVRVQDLFFWI